MEDIIKEFDLIVEQMTEAVANATSPEEAEKLQLEYDSKIDEAEKVLEEKLEEYNKQQEEILEKEQKASEKELEELEIVKEEVEVEEPVEPIEISIESIKEKYTVKELKALLKEAGVKGYSKLKEDELIELILKLKLL